MTPLRHLCSFVIGILVWTTGYAWVFNEVSPNTNKAYGAERPSSSELPGGWHFVRTHNPHGGADAIAIMHIADTSRSDLNLAGLMIRCREGGTEALIVLLRSFPLRARPHVVIGKPGNEIKFEATVAPPGTSVLLPEDAKILVNGPWRAQRDLFIRIEDGQSAIRGVIALADLQAAFNVLAANCPAQ